MSDQEQTYWNGERCQARRVKVRVADSEAFPGYWARPFVGQIRKAVEITYGSKVFYIDDEGYEKGEEERRVLEEHFPGYTALKGEDEYRVGHAGWGWEKVTKGRGSPALGHASLQVSEVVGNV